MTVAKEPTNFRILDDFPSPHLEQAWRKSLARVECPAHYNAPEFFLEPQLEPNRPFAILALDQGAVVGVLTEMHEGGPVVCGLQSRPQICVDSAATAATDALAAGLLARGQKVQLLTVYSECAALDAFMRYGFRVRQMQGCVVLDLKLGPERLFKQFDSNRRRNIRLAIRRGVEIFEGSTPEDIAAYYDVYLRWRRTPRKKIVGPELPFTLFERVYRLTTNRKVLLARFSGKVIGGITLRLCPGGLVEFSEGCALEEFLHLKPNDLLQMRVIEWACSNGFRRYSLGAAGPFHRRFGGAAIPTYRYRLDRTLIHRYYLQEALADRTRKVLHKMPAPVQNFVRHLLRKKLAGVLNGLS